MKLSTDLVIFLFSLLLLLFLPISEQCNIGFGNVGVGNIGLFNRGVLNRGYRNTGYKNYGLRNTGANNVGYLNRLSYNTIGFANFLANRRVGAFDIFTQYNPSPA